VADEPRPRGRPKGTGKPIGKTITMAEGRARKNWTVDDPPRRVLAFVEWFAYQRQIGQTQGNIGRPTLAKWMRDPRVLQLLDNALRLSNAGPQRVQDVLDMLHKRATVDEDVKAAQVYLQAVDRLVPKRQVDIVLHDARTLSDRELHAELRRAVELLENQRGVLEPPIEEAEVIEDVVEDTG
jgi:hypothetical protein